MDLDAWQYSLIFLSFSGTTIAHLKENTTDTDTGSVIPTAIITNITTVIRQLVITMNITVIINAVTVFTMQLVDVLVMDIVCVGEDGLVQERNILMKVNMPAVLSLTIALNLAHMDLFTKTQPVGMCPKSTTLWLINPKLKETN